MQEIQALGVLWQDGNVPVLDEVCLDLAHARLALVCMWSSKVYGWVNRCGSAGILMVKA
jgi:hypothetical protein